MLTKNQLPLNRFSGQEYEDDLRETTNFEDNLREEDNLNIIAKEDDSDKEDDWKDDTIETEKLTFDDQCGQEIGA